jgi:hypothetical protein
MVERLARLTVRQVPQPNAPVASAGSEQITIGIDRERQDIARVSAQRAERVAFWQSPQPDGILVRSRGQ